MRTPAGSECRYYYEDYNRGREQQECRLVAANRASLPWKPEYCAKCDIPAILRANGSPHLSLQLTIRKRFGLFTVMDVEATCLKHACEIDDPYRGCPACAKELLGGGAGDG